MRPPRYARAPPAGRSGTKPRGPPGPTAEPGHTVEKRRTPGRSPCPPEALLNAQYDPRRQEHGCRSHLRRRRRRKGETVNLLHEWMDPRRHPGARARRGYYDGGELLAALCCRTTEAPATATRKTQTGGRPGHRPGWRWRSSRRRRAGACWRSRPTPADRQRAPEESSRRKGQACYEQRRPSRTGATSSRARPSAKRPRYFAEQTSTAEAMWIVIEGTDERLPQPHRAARVILGLEAGRLRWARRGLRR